MYYYIHVIEFERKNFEVKFFGDLDNKYFTLHTILNIRNDLLLITGLKKLPKSTSDSFKVYDEGIICTFYIKNGETSLKIKLI